VTRLGSCSEARAALLLKLVEPPTPTKFGIEMVSSIGLLYRFTSPGTNVSAGNDAPVNRCLLASLLLYIQIAVTLARDGKTSSASPTANETWLL
jgi:hypothetical protein